MPNKGLEILEARIRESIALARHRLYLKPVRVVRGRQKGKRGVVQSVSIGPQGELLAAIRTDERHASQRHYRYILPVGLLAIGERDAGVT